MTPQTIIFIGRSGCGKGTQAEFMKKYFADDDSQKRPIFYLETGVGFRQLIKGTGYTERLAHEAYERSNRQPDYLAIWMWSHQFIEKMTGEEHLIIDGTPRSLSEAMVLNNALDFYGRRANIVYLDISAETSKKRLTERGRSDDLTAEKIDKRMEWFSRDVIPAVEYLKTQSAHNFIHINAEQTIENVHADILAALKTN